MLEVDDEVRKFIASQALSRLETVKEVICAYGQEMLEDVLTPFADLINRSAETTNPSLVYQDVAVIFNDMNCASLRFSIAQNAC